MTQEQVIEQIAAEFGIPKTKAKEIYFGIGRIAADAIKQGEKFPIPNVGKLEPVKRNARIGRNPRTGEAINVAAKKSVKLTISQAFNDELN